MRDILTISDALVEPPNEQMVFYTITMISHSDYAMSVLFHTTQEMKDIYYHWMKPRGLMDYVCEILNEFEYEEGVRVDTIGIYPTTIVTPLLRIDNQRFILDQIRLLANRP